MQTKNIICHHSSIMVSSVVNPSWRKIYFDSNFKNQELLLESPWRKVHFGKYYNLTITPAYMNLFEDEFKLNDPDWITADRLSNKTRGSVTIRLPFEFPFYGHNITRFFLTTEGFISLAERIHSEVNKLFRLSPV